MDLFNKLLTDTNNILTGYVLLVALVGGGIWFTFSWALFRSGSLKEA